MADCDFCKEDDSWEYGNADRIFCSVEMKPGETIKFTAFCPNECAVSVPFEYCPKCGRKIDRARIERRMTDGNLG